MLNFTNVVKQLTDNLENLGLLGGAVVGGLAMMNSDCSFTRSLMTSGQTKTQRFYNKLVNITTGVAIGTICGNSIDGKPVYFIPLALTTYALLSDSSNENKDDDDSDTENPISVIN